MASAPDTTTPEQKGTSLADTSRAVDTRLAPVEGLMAPTPTSPSQPSASPSRGLSPQPPGGGEMDSIANALAGAKVSSSTPPPADLQRKSSAAQRVQENLAQNKARQQQAPQTGEAPPPAPAVQEQQSSHHLYIGNLSPKISEDFLREVFEEHGQVLNVKILIHHHPQYPPGGMYGHPHHPGTYVASGLVAPQMVPGESNYGFVEMRDYRQAQQAVRALDGKDYFNMPLKVSWAKQQRTPASGGSLGDGGAGALGRAASGYEEGASGRGAPSSVAFGHGLYHVFVGDLSPEVNDAVLRNHFAESYGSLHEARVMWDMHSGKSRGYGFLAFKDRADAENAIRSKHGDWLGGRSIRVNWASSKNAGSNSGGGSSANASDALASTISGIGAGSGSASRSARVGWGSASPKNGSRSNLVQQQVAIQAGLARGPMNSYNTPLYAFGQQPPPGGQAAPAQPTAVAGVGSPPQTHAQVQSQRPNTPPTSGVSAAKPEGPSTGGGSSPPTYEEVLQQTPAHNTTVYLGNLPVQTSQEELLPLFQHLGLVIEVRMQPDRGYGFVKLDTHENAAQAIVQLQGAEFGGRRLRSSWGKDRQDSGPAGGPRSQRNSFSSHAVAGSPSHHSASPLHLANSMSMMYGMMPPFGFTGGFYPGLMPMHQMGFAGAPGALGQHPHHAAAGLAALQQQMAALQAHAEAQARHQRQTQPGQQRGGASPLRPSGMLMADQSQPEGHMSPQPDGSLPESSSFFPGPYGSFPSGFDSSVDQTPPR